MRWTEPLFDDLLKLVYPSIIIATVYNYTAPDDLHQTRIPPHLLNIVGSLLTYHAEH